MDTSDAATPVPTGETPPASGAEPGPEAFPPAEAVVAPPAEPPLLPPPLPQAPPDPPAEPFVFHGQAREYFRIWIVNTLLTVLTLGVFSAWAKVRKRRYLRGNTELLGHRFDYTADPRRLLVGNLIIVVMFLAYALFGSVYPAVRFIALGLAVVFLPWVIVRSLAFNAHNTVWRGLRFRFHPSLSAAVMVYLLRPLLIPVTLGFYYPAWARAAAEFRISRHRLGTAFFYFEAKNGPFYRAYLSAGVILFAAVMIVGFGVTYLTSSHGGHVPTQAQLIPLLLFYGAVFYLTKHLIFAMLFNPMWNATRLNGHCFRANLRTGRWLGLQITNLAATVVSCGLLYPWAVMRSARYALGCLSLQPDGPLEDIARVDSTAGNAVSDTAAEFAGLDFGL